MHVQLPAGRLPNHKLPVTLADLRGSKLGATVHDGARDDVSTILLLGAGNELLRTAAFAVWSVGARGSRTCAEPAAGWSRRTTTVDRSGCDREPEPQRYGQQFALLSAAGGDPAGVRKLLPAVAAQ